MTSERLKELQNTEDSIEQRKKSIQTIQDAIDHINDKDKHHGWWRSLLGEMFFVDEKTAIEILTIGKQDLQRQLKELEKEFSES